VIPPAARPSPAFLAPATDPQLPGYESLATGTSSGYGEVASVDRNPQTGEVTVRATNSGAERYPWGVERYQETITHRTSDAAPEDTSVTGTHRMEVEVGNRRLRWEAELDFTSDAHDFHYVYTRRLLENGRLVRDKVWRETIPRDFQ
jgi:hypothetical protein